MTLDFKSLALSVVIAILGPATSGHTADGGLNGYDFSYAIAGDAKVTPIQVFDDGAQTYFQFKTTDDMPAIFLIDKGRQDLVQVTARSPYVVVGGLAQRFALRSGGAVASVDYVGSKRNNAALPTARAASGPMSASGAIEPVPRGRTASQDGADFARLLATLQKTIRVQGSALAVSPAARTPAVHDSLPADTPPGFRAVTRKDVPFFRGHSTLGRLGSKAMQGVLEEARSADRIIVTGRPDANDAATLAAARGNTLKAFFLARGISAEKVEIREEHVARPAEMKDVYLSEVAFGRTLAGGSLPDAAIRVKTEVIGRARQAVASRETQPSVDLLPVFQSTMTLLSQGKITQDAAAALLAIVAHARDESEAAAPLAQPIAARPVWEMSQTDGTLRNALARWASASGWQLSWDIPFDYPINLAAQFPGSFEEAVASVAKSLETAEAPIQVTFYRANKVMRVLAGGGQKK